MLRTTLAQYQNFSSHMVNGVPMLSGFEVIFNNVVLSLLTVAALALFIMLIVGGIKLLTSAGNPKSIESAKNTITYAILGIFLVSISYLILYAIHTFTGADILNFRVTNP